MKIKNLTIIALMILFIFILNTKAQAVENVEENKEYEINQEIELKALPLMFSREKAKIANGKINVTEILNDWCKIENSEESGWVRINTIKYVITENSEQENNVEQNNNQEENKQDDENQENTDNETDSNNEITSNDESDSTSVSTGEVKELDQIGYVSADGLNVRKEPSVDSESIHSYSFNARVTITGEIDGWYRIRYQGQDGYVSKKYISDEKLPETTSRGGIERATVEVEQEVNETDESDTTDSTNETNTETEQSQDSSNQSNEQESTETSTGVTGAEVVAFAKQYLGYKYVSGGASPSTGFDCSGFTSYVFKHFGITLNRASTSQANNGVAVDKSDLQAGDLLIYKNEAKTAVGHVGIYLGDGTFIHASNKKDGVKITSMSLNYYAQRYVGARRVI